MKIKVYNLKSKKTSNINLNDNVFGIDWHNDLVHQSVLAHRENNRQQIAHTKGTSEVRGGGRKPWRQKGTGRARHGTTRSPLWKGGGVTFGPKNLKNFGQKINKKMKRKALFSVLSKKNEEKEIIIVDFLKLENNKTKEGQSILDNLSKSIKDIKKKTVLFLPESNNKVFLKAVSNIKGVNAMSPKNLNIYDLLSYKYIIFDQKSVEELEEHFKLNKS